MQMCGDILSKEKISSVYFSCNWHDLMGRKQYFQFISPDWRHLCSQCACKCRPGAGGHVQVYWDYPGNKTMYFMLFTWEHSCFLSWYFRGERESTQRKQAIAGYMATVGQITIHLFRAGILQ